MLKISVHLNMNQDKAFKKNVISNKKWLPNYTISSKVTAMVRGVCKCFDFSEEFSGEFPYVVHTTKYKVDHNL